jgi:hypothetical protein
MNRTRTLSSFVLGLSLIAAAAATPAEAAGRVGPIKVKLTARDQARLKRLKSDHRRQIGPHTHDEYGRRYVDRAGNPTQVGYTPVVDLPITEASSQAGVRWRKLKDPRMEGVKGPTVFEVEGIDQAGGEINMVLTGSASGHVMSENWGGRPFADVQRYADTDIVHLTHRAPGATSTTSVVRTKSQGFVTQEGFSINLSEKGTHDFYYYRRASSDAPGSGGGEEESEPELRHVQIIVK